MSALLGHKVADEKLEKTLKSQTSQSYYLSYRNCIVYCDNCDIPIFACWVCLLKVNLLLDPFLKG